MEAKLQTGIRSAIDDASLEPPRVTDNPIGVFDSGVGGLSVLRHIRAHLPHEHLLYFADSGFAPYGGKPEHIIVARTLSIADFLLKRGAKALVVACNTATAAAISALRLHYPTLPLIGVEPGLKPAAALTTSNIVGVLATEFTLASGKFTQLRAELSETTGVRFLSQACIGLVDQIEKGELHSATTARMLQGYVKPLIEQGADTLVLGCTHYPFVQPLIEEILGQITHQEIAIIDTGDAVVRQLVRVLTQRGLLSEAKHTGPLEAFTTGSETTLLTAFATLLKLQPNIIGIGVESPIAQPF